MIRVMDVKHDTGHSFLTLPKDVLIADVLLNLETLQVLLNM
jgi:hypothetical protein